MCRPKHVEQLRNIGIINSTARLHLVSSFYEIFFCSFFFFQTFAVFVAKYENAVLLSLSVTIFSRLNGVYSLLTRHVKVMDPVLFVLGVVVKFVLTERCGDNLR